MQEFKCPLCRKEYSQDNPPRLLTMCGHTFCHQCIKQHIQHHQYQYQISCPIDKLNIKIDSDTPSHFPRNMLILELIAYYQRQKQQKSQHLVSSTVDLNHYNNEKSRGQKIQGSDESTLKSNKQIQSQGELCCKNQQELCLLHQKPLDIICTQDKCTICAECALFGLHKGHKFTTIKQLLWKQKCFKKSVGCIVNQRQQMMHKIHKGQFQQQIGLILGKKRQLLLYELSNVVKEMTLGIAKFEQEWRGKVDERIKEMKDSFSRQLQTNIESNSKFDAWVQNIQGLIQSEDKDIEHLISISQYCNKPAEGIERGKQLLSDIQKEIIDFWNRLEQNIQYPKIIRLQPIQQYLSDNIKVMLFQQKKEDSILDESSLKIWSQINVSCIEDNSFIDDVKADLKLLDYSCIQEGSTHLSSILKNFQDQAPFQSRKPALRKPKHKELTIHSTLLQFTDKVNPFKSPKTKLKLQPSTTKCLTSPMFKNKLKKFALRVKESDKFLKIVDSLQSNCLELVDLTGFEVGDEVGRQICIKILECSKVKMLKLMKNQLTDACIKEVIEVLKIVDFLNLAQNAFTQKIIESLLIFSTQHILSKPKSIQLGQNQINSRRLKQKFEELKRCKITITL